MDNSLPPEKRRIVILTGAGISKESGLDTFRDEGGIWFTVNIEDVATPEAYERDPVRVQEFYNHRRRNMAGGNVAPNAAHEALAKLEREWPGEVLLVTQNIDDLHEKGGSSPENIVHMHGEMLKARCENCGTIHHWEDDLSTATSCPDCGATGLMRPHVVWFGEMPLEMDRIYKALDDCWLFVSIGTSGNVYPAAGFVSHVRMQDKGHTVELNLEPSEGASAFAETIYGPATEVVPSFVDQLLSAS